MSIPPPPGPHEPQDPFRAPQAPSSPGAQPPGGPYGPYPQGPYGAPYPGWGQGYTPYNRQAPVNGVAIAALVLGVMCFLPAVGLVLGIVALVQIRRKGERGKPLAIVGAVLSSLGLALWIVSLSTGAASAVWDGFKEGLSGNASLSLEKGDCFDVPGATSTPRSTTSTPSPAPVSTTPRCSRSYRSPGTPTPATARSRTSPRTAAGTYRPRTRRTRGPCPTPSASTT